MTPRENVYHQIRHEQTDTVPYTLSIDSDLADRVTEYYGNDDWKATIRPSIVQVAYLDRIKHQSIGNQRTRDLYGGIWRWDQKPAHQETYPLNGPSLDGFTFPPASDSVTPDYDTQTREAIQNASDQFTVVQAGWGLWESTWGLRGFENAMVDCIAEPDFFAELLDGLTERYLEQIELFRDIPVDAIFFGDDWSDQRGVMVGPERWRKMFKPRYEKIYRAAKEQGKIVMTHCCGSVVEILDDLIEIGLDVIESVQPEAEGMSPYALKKQWGDKIAFWGCLGSQSTIPFGTPEEVRTEVAKLKREMSRGGGYILAPAKSLQPETPIENAIAIIEAFNA